MNGRQYVRRAATLIILFMIIAIFAPQSSEAEFRYVVKNANECPTGSPTPACYTSITEAINNASSGDSIEIRPGTYTGTYTLSKNVSIYGNETARTILSGGGAGPILTVDGATIAMSIRRLSFINASSAIHIRNSPSVTISNNIFEVGSAGTAVQTTSASGTQIINNTFYSNGTGVLSDLNTLSIINNIFSNNGTAISANVVVDGILNNLFYSNSTIGPTGIIFTSTDQNYKGNIRDQDPLFVDISQSDISKRDFHLKSGTPCSDAGNATGGSDKIDGSTADIGAYGGSESDTVPFPVQNLISSKTSPTSVQLTWSSNLCYQVAGYTIRYGTAADSLSTTIDAGTVTTYEITGLSPASPPTGAPVLSHDIANHTLKLSWTTDGVTGATGYEVRYVMDGPPTGNTCPYSTIPTASDPFIDAQNEKSYPLSGLDNEICYSVVVVPYAQTTYYFTVTAHYANTAFESANSNIEDQQIGDLAYDSDISNVIHDFPEPIMPYPALPNKGCFIATAAYGYYSAPQVLALRQFRDQYLVTNASGRAFVAWYYRVGPGLADLITRHPSLKPMARTALLPAVGFARFMTQTTPMMKLTVLLSLAITSILIILSVRAVLVRKHPERRPR